MLRYENIYEVSGARRRLTDNYRDRYSWRQDGRNRETDQLALFTFEMEAVSDSQRNLEFLLDTARDMHQQYVILLDNKVQIAGEDWSDRVGERLAPQQWQIDFSEWIDDHNGRTVPVAEKTQRGGVATLHSWRRCFTLKEHQGVYDVSTGRRMTNREEIIRAFWSLGFSTWRGRPYSIAKLRWSGEREELEELTALAGRYWNNRTRTDVAKKIVSAYRSINRYAAWPGSW